MKDDLQSLLTETKRICEDATSGEWNNEHEMSFAQEDLLVHARTALPRLVAALELAVSQRDNVLNNNADYDGCPDPMIEIKMGDAELARVLRGET